MRPRIIGLGQEWAGDDGVGIAVIRSLRELSLQQHLVVGEDGGKGSDKLEPALVRGDALLDLVETSEPTQVIDLLTDGADPVVIVDAVVDNGSAGRVLIVDAQKPAYFSGRLLSTHGVGVMETIELARIAHPERLAPRIFIVGISIQRATRGGNVLSTAVADAIPFAAARALEMAKS